MINGGIYLFTKDVLSLCDTGEKFVSLENEIFPLLLENGKIYAQSFEDDFIDIGIPEDYIRSKTLIQNWANRQR